MFRNSEFSESSRLTVKALRFYEKERLLILAHVEKWPGSRFPGSALGGNK